MLRFKLNVSHRPVPLNKLFTFRCFQKAFLRNRGFCWSREAELFKMEKGEGDSSIFLLYARVLTQCSFSIYNQNL